MEKTTVLSIPIGEWFQFTILENTYRSFEFYCKKDFTQKNLAPNRPEMALSTTAIVMLVASIEAYKMRLLYFDRSNYEDAPYKYFPKKFQSKDSKFPILLFEELLMEFFVLRDVIVHCHLWEVETHYDDDWEYLAKLQKHILGGDKKFKTAVRGSKTIKLGLNVQIFDIGFEDLFTMLILFDCFTAIGEQILGSGYISRVRSVYKVDSKTPLTTLSSFICHIYNKLPNSDFVDRLRVILKTFKQDFGRYLPPDLFLNNVCLKCGEFGYRKEQNHNVNYSCSKCGYKIEIKSRGGALK